MKEKITVIVTIYNRLEYAKNIIKSLLNQTVQIDELIFADDGSSENLVNSIKGLMSECKFKIKHVYQEDFGFRLARSRNNASRVTNNDYLIFMDQDIIIPPDLIEKIVKHKKRGRLVYSKAIMSNEEQKEKIQGILNKSYNYKKLYSFTTQKQREIRNKVYKKDKFYSFIYDLKLRSRGAKIAGLFFSLYKEDFIKINGFDEKYEGWGYEDDDFCNRLFKAGIKTYPIHFDRYPIHMYHPFDPTKAESPNEKYYRRRKKEISKKNYKCEYGYKNTLGKDQYTVYDYNLGVCDCLDGNN